MHRLTDPPAPKRARYIFDGIEHTPRQFPHGASVGDHAETPRSAGALPPSPGLKIGDHAEITCQTLGSSPFFGMIGLVMGFDKGGDPLVMFDGHEAPEVFYKHDVTARRSGDHVAELIAVED